jgi:hypothetical protein
VRIVVRARRDAKGSWVQVGASEGSERVDLRWPTAWRDDIVEQVKFELAYPPGTTAARIDRVLLYPAANAYAGGIRKPSVSVPTR